MPRTTWHDKSDSSPLKNSKSSHEREDLTRVFESIHREQRNRFPHLQDVGCLPQCHRGVTDAQPAEQPISSSPQARMGTPREGYGITGGSPGVRGSVAKVEPAAEREVGKSTRPIDEAAW